MSLFHILLFMTLTGQSVDPLLSSQENTVLVLKQTSRQANGDPLKAYELLLQGFIDGTTGKSLSLFLVDIYDEQTLKLMTGKRYRIVVGLGTNPARIATELFSDTPLIYSMVLNPGSHDLSDLSDATDSGVQGGVLGRVHPSHYVREIRRFQPEAKRIGLLYSEKFESYVDELRQEGEKVDLSFVSAYVEDKKELMQRLKIVLDQDVDLFLMLPDTWMYGQSYKHIFMQTLKVNVPCLGPSQSYVQAGAMWGVILSPYDIGVQSAEMLQKALNNEKIGIEYPLVNKVIFNYTVASKLKISFPENAVEEARKEGRVVE